MPTPEYEPIIGETIYVPEPMIGVNDGTWQTVEILRNIYVDEPEAIQKPLTKRKRLKIGAALFGGISTAGLLTYGAVSFVQDNSDYLINKLGYGNLDTLPPGRGEGIEGLEKYYELIDDSEDFKDTILDSFILGRESFASYSDYRLKTDFSSETIDEIKEERLNIVLEGIYVLGNVLSIEGIEIDEKGTVKFPEMPTLDLRNTYHLLLIDQYITSLIKAQTDEFPSQEHQERALDMIWLANSNMDIEVKEGAFGLINSNVFVGISRIGQKAEQLGYEVPDKIKFKPWPTGHIAIGEYHSHDDSVSLTEVSSGEGAVHEFAHFYADESQEFSQEVFDSIVRETEQEILNLGQVNDGKAYVSEYAKTNNLEDYAETMMYYFFRGSEFRNKLKYAREIDSPAYEIIKTKYEFMKEFFRGEEYLSSGTPFAPQIGDLVSIDDPDPYQEPILMSLEFPSETSDNAVIPVGFLYHGDVVKILGGPVEAHYSYMNMERKSYKVQLELVNGELIEGWVSDIWLGDKVPQID